MNKKLSRFRRLRWVCRAIVVAVTAASIWANMLNAGHNAAAIAIHVFPPLFFFAALEITSRVPFRKEDRWYWKLSRGFGTLIIAGISAYLSYRNQSTAFHRYADDQTAILLPLSIDGMMIVASVTLMVLNARIEQIEAFIEAGKVSTYKKPEEPILVKPKDEREPSKKERIAAILSRSPELTNQEIGDLTNSSLNYVYSVRRALSTVPAEEETPQLEPAFA
jgi:hypothetical protein